MLRQLCLAIGAAGLTVGSESGTISTFNSSTGAFSSSIKKAHDGHVTCIAQSPLGVVSGGKDGCVKLWAAGILRTSLKCFCNTHQAHASTRSETSPGPSPASASTLAATTRPPRARAAAGLSTTLHMALAVRCSLVTPLCPLVFSTPTASSLPPPNTATRCSSGTSRASARL
jgi:hypothetical protein